MSQYKVRIPKDKYKGIFANKHRFDVDSVAPVLLPRYLNVVDCGEFMEIIMPKWIAITNRLSRHVVQEVFSEEELN